MPSYDALLGFACALAAVVIIFTVVMIVDQTTNVPASKTNIVVFPGRVALNDASSVTPQIVLQVHWGSTAVASEVFLNGKTDTLTVPKQARTTGVLNFLNGLLSPRDICNTFSDATQMVYSNWTTRATPVKSSSSVRLPELGCSQRKLRNGTYASPFIDMLTRKGYSAWTIMERDWKVAVLPGIVRAPCLQWNWTPLLPDPAGLYVIGLRPSADAPWTRAVLDFGSYFSTLPGIASTDTTLTLVTSTGVSVFLNVSFYVSAQPASLTCVLGVAALAWFSAATLDLANQRLGLPFTRIGNVQSNAAPFVFT